MNLQNAVRLAAERHGLFPRGAAVIVGVSGGADSLALLHALAVLRKRLDIRLVAATLDHGLRGEAGASDAEYVMAQAEAWRVPAVQGRADVRALAETGGMGIEEAARQARYGFLAEEARAHGADRIAVAHHAGDQAETVLMHLLRGAGVDGLAGMRPLAPLPGAPDLLLLRPMLGITRAQIEAWCAQHGITPREDASNRDTAFTRAWLRYEALPLLETRFPGAARALAHLAESAALDEAFLHQALNDTLIRAAVTTSDSVHLPRADFAAAAPAIQRRFLRWAAGQLAPGAELSAERTEAAVTCWMAGRGGAVLELPAGLRATVENGNVILRKAPKI